MVPSPAGIPRNDILPTSTAERSETTRARRLELHGDPDAPTRRGLDLMRSGRAPSRLEVLGSLAALGVLRRGGLFEVEVAGRLRRLRSARVAAELVGVSAEVLAAAAAPRWEPSPAVVAKLDDLRAAAGRLEAA